LQKVLENKGFLVNRIEINFSGQHAILVCEVLIKTNFKIINKKEKKIISFTDYDLKEISLKLKPYLSNRKLVIRLNFLDGLLKHPTLAHLKEFIHFKLKNKNLGSGISFLVSDLLNSICLIT
jgi:hypothetical protein